MKSNIVAIGIQASEVLKDYVSHRLETVLSRAKNSIQDITIRLSNLNGGGLNKRCLIQVKLLGLAPIVVSDLAADMTSAIDISTSRLHKVLSRALSKAKKIPHVTMPLYMKKSFLGT